MKKIVFGGLFIAVLGVVIYSCNKESNQLENNALENDDSQSSFNSSQQSAKSKYDTDKVFFPKGTLFDTIENSLTFTAPDGWKYVYLQYDVLEAKVGGATGSLTCTCTQTEEGASEEGGCHPQVHQSSGSLSCVITSPCSQCNKDVSLAADIALDDIKRGGIC
ncbi:MAG: hypothetical protein ACQERC_11720 [Bacteroidota bacterium]